MNKFKANLAKIKDNLQKKLIEILKIKANTVADVLTILALVIIFSTTFVLNKAVGMYILAVELLIISYFISKN